MSMKIYHPMMFVGLGGTGCLIGTELERRLRDDLCGPEGTDLFGRVPGKTYMPFQLPSCLQFVYADLNESELTKLRRRIVPSEAHQNAAGPTLHLAHDLVPRYDTYPEVALSLRTNAPEEIRDWLPGPVGEPRVAPLVRGAGQLPTVGRAALFETFRGGLAPARAPLVDAVGAISNSGGELNALGGGLGKVCTVFVAFSVAGGTGAGIFYDYLHLIGDVFKSAGADYKPQIFPLVLMPSAFEEGMGGGRRAKLNAGRALLDLFRLVDDQNGRTAQRTLTDRGLVGELGVQYPSRTTPVVLDPSTIQTAFLFSRSYGVERDDLHRSVVSLVLSLLGTGTEHDAEDGQVGEQTYQSFADDFINRGVERQAPASSGIGLQGASTSLVASLTVPVDDLADIVAGRLLARAVEQLSEPGAGEENGALVHQFMSASNLDPLRTRWALDFNDPEPVRGSDAILEVLRTRIQSMEANTRALQSRVRRDVPELVANFDPTRAFEQLLSEADLFRLRRVVFGDPHLVERIDQTGFLGVLEARKAEPTPPYGIGFNPPQLPAIRDRRMGLSRIRWGDPVVQDEIRRQDAWYEWRAKCAWNAAWAEQANRWDRPATRFRNQLRALNEAFREHVQAEPGSFAQRSGDLHRPRVGITYMLPPGGDMDTFYNAVLARFIRIQQQPANATEGEVVNQILGVEGRRAAWTTAVTVSPQAAVSAVRDRLKNAVKSLFVRDSDIDGLPLLPRLRDLLAAAARGSRSDLPFNEEDVHQLRTKLAGLVPAGFSPQGTGQLKVLISYSAKAADPQVEDFLQRMIRLPQDSGNVEFRAIDAESIAVVLFRTSMSITEVPELRDILHHWADALQNEQRQDFLQWRQRLGYDFGWLATTEEDRVRIMYRLLSAMWNGQVTASDGSEESPREIEVTLDRDNAVAMTLRLVPFEAASSWSNVIRAYENWALVDDARFRRDFSERLIETNADGDRHPAPIFRRFVETAEKQVELIEELIPRLPAEGRSWSKQLLGFWRHTVPAAMEIQTKPRPGSAGGSLRELYERRRVVEEPGTFTKRPPGYTSEER